MRTIIHPSVKRQKQQYPCFKRSNCKSTDGDMVILFTAPGEGTVVAIDDEMYYEIGHHTKTWIEERYDSFSGSIEIV